MDTHLLSEIQQGQEDWAFHIGAQAYIWGLPIVECWKDRLSKSRNGPGSCGDTGADTETVYVTNTFRHARHLASSEQSEFVNSATDFIYSTAVIDLSKGPLLLTAADFQNRWYGIQILDAYMETLANLGTRTYGRQLPPVIISKGEYNGKMPEGAACIQSDIDYVFIVARIAVDPNEDLAPVHALQDALRLKMYSTAQTNLSHNNGAGTGARFELEDRSVDCPAEISFFHQLGKALKFVPPKSSETMLLGMLNDIGISTEHGLDIRRLTPSMVKGLQKAIPFAQSILDRQIYSVGKNINGWGILFDIGNYDSNYINRALVAQHGIWANVPEESMYFMAHTDCEGQLLHGGQNYRIHFPVGQTPPVDAFWSISYYDQHGRIIKAPQGNNAVNSLYSPLHYNNDGSLDIIISQHAPEPELRSNWLAAHDGLFKLNLRCYNPRRALLQLDYQVPPIIRAD